MKTARLMRFALGAALLLVPLPVTAEVAEDGLFTGGFELGFRSVDVTGADRKYKEDVNLDDGPRLFDFHFDLVPSEGMRSFADRVELSANNLGGDSYETLHFGVRRFGSYNFRYDRRKSNYFYDDIIIPSALVTPDSSAAGDFHTFDFDRVQEKARIDIDLSQAAKLHFGLERFTKKGESTTTLDVSRDEFEMDRPIDESMNSYLAGFRYAWDKVTLVLEERIRDYENMVEIFLPGFSLGEAVEDDETTLDFFFLDQPYDYTSLEHSVSLIARPNDRLDVRIATLVQDLELDVAAEQSAQGIDFTGAPFTLDAEGSGGIDRDVELIDVDLGYRINERVSLVGGVRQKNLDQSGSFLFDERPNQGSWDIETTAFEAGVQIQVSPTVTVALGGLQETRDVSSSFTLIEEEEVELETDQLETDHTGFYGTLVWRPANGCQLSLDLEDSTVDDPYTLASPTGRQRYRLQGSKRWESGLKVSGSYLMKDYENDNSGWTADTEQIEARLGYQREDLILSLGYATVDLENAIDQLVTGGFRMDLFNILYKAESDFVDGRVRYQVSDRFALGGDFRTYSNDGSFGIDRDDLRAYVDVAVARGYSVQVGYRSIDYDETDFDFDDYDADILEVSLGYAW